jgi:hypothetical protein
MEERVAKTFVSRVKSGDFGSGLAVTYRVLGGRPSQRLDYTVAVDPVDGIKVTAYDARASREVKHQSFAPQTFDVPNLFEKLSAGLQSLLPASKAEFPPDALVGSITISVDNRQETFYFAPEEEKRKAQDWHVAPQADEALRQFWNIAKRVSGSQKEPRYE